MRKRHNVTLLLVGLLTLSFFVPGISSAAKDNVYEFTYASPVGPDHSFSFVDKEWIAKIEKESNGRIKIKPYWSGTLVGGRGAIDEIAKGVADIGFISPGYARSGYDFTRKSFLFFIGANQETGRRIFKEMMAKFPQIEGEYRNLKVLAWSSGMDYQLLSRKPVRTLDDLKGMRIKTIGDLVSVLGEFGADGTSTPTPEVYVSLQKGILDGTLTPFEGFKSLNLGEVIKYATYLDLYRPHTGGRAMNLKVWEKLPKDIQTIFENNIEWYGLETDRHLGKVDEEGFQVAQQLGVEFINLSKADLNAFYEPIRVLADNAAKELDEKGIPGTEMLQEARRLIEKYSK